MDRRKGKNDKREKLSLRLLHIGKTAMSIFTGLALLVCAVQPWNLPIPILEEDIQIRSLQGGSNLPLSEELNEKGGEKLQNSTHVAFFQLPTDHTTLKGDGRDNVTPAPFFEVPTPPPRG